MNNDTVRTMMVELWNNLPGCYDDRAKSLTYGQLEGVLNEVYEILYEEVFTDGIADGVGRILSSPNVKVSSSKLVVSDNYKKLLIQF